MRTTKRTWLFGCEFNYVAFDAEGIRALPGADRIAAVASNPEQAAHASWWTFEDERAARERWWRLGPDDYVLDVGAAFGSYALSAAAQGARVLAMEPLLFCRSVLAANLDVNPGLRDRVFVSSIGAHERHGWFDPDANEFFASEPPEKEGRILLAVSPIDERLFVDERVTMIKVDVEGGELGVLRGAAETIKAHRPRLFVENHEFKAPGIGEECRKFVESLGLGYRHETVPYHSITHTFYDVP